MQAFGLALHLSLLDGWGQLTRKLGYIPAMRQTRMLKDDCQCWACAGAAIPAYQELGGSPR